MPPAPELPDDFVGLLKAAEAHFFPQGEGVPPSLKATSYPNPESIASIIDHTLLTSSAKPQEVADLCTEAVALGTATVCVNASYAEQCSAALKGTDVRVCCVVGFPLGAMGTRGKVEEAREAIELGANEIDVVVHIGHLLSGNLEYVYHDIHSLTSAFPGTPFKVILETALLTPRDILVGTLLAAHAGAAFVKTSTGFSAAGGARVDDVQLMRAACEYFEGTTGRRVRVKASGGIRTREDVSKMLASGAERIGASRTSSICKEGTETGDSESKDGY